MTDPRPRIGPPKSRMNKPNPPSMMLIRISAFLLSSFSSISINCDTNMEFINIATNNEDPNTTESVIGKYFINCPKIPGQKASGTKAATVVSVEIIMGKAISPIPFFAASVLDMPSPIRRYTFSTTTIPLSTSIPRPMIIPKRIMVFKVYPNSDSTIKEMNIDMGIAKPTNSAFRNPKKNINTVTTRMIPKIILLTKSST